MVLAHPPASLVPLGACQERIQVFGYEIVKELEDATNYYDLYAQWLPDYYIDNWMIGRNEGLLYQHFDRLYIITPQDDTVRRHFQELIDNAKRTYLDESGQTQPYQADRVEILHETGDKVRDTAVTVTDEKIVSELKGMYDALQTQATCCPIAEERFVLTFYQEDSLAWTWWIAPWGDDGWVITSSSLEQGNYRVTNGFDFDRLAELSEGQQTEARDGTVSLSDLISSDVSSVKVNGQGETVELNESELAEFFEITKGIEYRITGEGEKDLMAVPGAATVTITVQYSDGESEQFTLPYCLHEDTMYIAPAQSIVPFSRYLTGGREGGPITVTLNGQETPITLTEDEHVWLTVDPATVTATGAIVVLHKEGIPEIGYGHRYHIAQKERQNSRRWTEVPWIDGFSGDWFLPLIVMGFTPDGIPNLGHRESNLPVNWEDIYGPLEPGEYLFVKEVVDPDDRSTGRYIGVEFTVN